VLRISASASKQGLNDRNMAAVNHFNREPVIHTWS
jgi:hypothetical protein